MAQAANTPRGRAPHTTPRARLRHRLISTVGAFPVAAALRGAVALALPLLAGVATGRTTLAVIAAIGTLWGVSQDGSDPYRTRARRLCWMGLASALGLLAGELALRTGQTAAVTVCLVVCALVGGAISLRERTASVAGMHLLLGATIGGGIPVPGPWWQAPIALLTGVGLMLVLSATPWLWRRHLVERAAVQAVYRAASEALAAAGTGAAEDARRRLTDALDDAHHMMGRYLTSAGPRRLDPEADRLLRAFRVAARLGEAVTTLLWERRPLPATVVNMPLLIARRLLPDDRDAAVQQLLPDDRDTAVRTLPDAPRPAAPVPPAADPDSPGLRALADLRTAADAERIDDVALSLPARPRQSRSVHLRYAVLLATCVLAAQLCALLLDGPRGYWLPMTVAFVYQPDFGPLFRRALHRCIGTVVGVAAIGTVSLLTESTYAFIGGVALFGALMAVGVRHHYAVATTGLTAIVFVLVDLLGDHRALYGPRILDTAVASAIVLVAHFALWPRSTAGRADALTEAAVAAARRYQDLAPTAAPTQRHALRRAAYHQLAEARRAAANARREPVRPGHRLPDWEQTVTEAEQLCDTVTARSLSVRSHPRSLCGTPGDPVTDTAAE
ncbi:FUSC family protein [Streptomyces sp. NPDC047079]|uniref:FUSC family protein n=1 Tax=Streptomyces sp. NPDC047079 TaxID=3154607 RepID=UPI0033C424E9